MKSPDMKTEPFSFRSPSGFSCHSSAWMENMEIHKSFELSSCIKIVCNSTLWLQRSFFFKTQTLCVREFQKNIKGFNVRNVYEIALNTSCTFFCLCLFFNLDIFPWSLDLLETFCDDDIEKAVKCEILSLTTRLKWWHWLKQVTFKKI